MNKLYIKLMATNIKNGKQFYFPYILAGALTVLMYYNMLAIYYNEGLSHMAGGYDVKMIINIGTKVIVIFSFIFIFYTNSFIMKRRKKDIGIYNILGMEKRHIAKELFAETFVIAFIVIVGGLITGILFNKFVMMFLYKLLKFETSIKFVIQGRAILKSLVIFTILYALTMVYNILQVKLSNPVELLKGSNVGEREPKTRWLMAIAGFVCIGIGYYIAITTENPLAALALFFIAVVLVIIGTYCLFISGSIAFLKFLRNNKGYYYQKKHFTAVSGMIYRMKQNAAGLANICILSTMVLVMVSTTVSMFIGEEDILKTRYEAEVNISAHSGSITDSTALNEAVTKIINENGRSITDKYDNLELSYTGVLEGDEFNVYEDYTKYNYSDAAYAVFMTEEDFENAYNTNVGVLSGDEVVLVGNPEYNYDVFKIFGQTFKVQKYLEKGDDRFSTMSNVVGAFYYVIARDTSVLENVAQAAKASGIEEYYTYNLYINIDGTSGQKKECGKEVFNILTKEDKAAETGYTDIMVESRESNKESFYSVYGGLFFLGVFLGTIFLVITVLIIFYKQISEGYEDRERFIIMEKVGMGKKDVKASIRSQIRMVFLFPVVVAAVHVAAAFPMIKRLMLMLNMTNSQLYAKCTLVTILIFTLIYILVFILTSRTYYKIVGNENR